MQFIILTPLIFCNRRYKTYIQHIIYYETFHSPLDSLVSRAESVLRYFPTYLKTIKELAKTSGLIVLEHMYSGQYFGRMRWQAAGSTDEAASR